jgi:nitroreductase
MEFFETVRARRSIRKYTNTPVPEAVVNECLDAALLAPNSSNMQPWEFYWVQSPDKKKKLVEACLSQSAASTAAELVVAVARTDTWQRNQKLMLKLLEKETEHRSRIDYYKKLIPLVYRWGFFNSLGILKWALFNIAGIFKPMVRGPSFRHEVETVVIKTTALACENFMLAASALGYGTCPMEGFDECRVKRLLNLSGRAKIVMVISLGEVDPAGIWGEQVRFERSLFVHKV